MPGDLGDDYNDDDHDGVDHNDETYDEHDDHDHDINGQRLKSHD